MSSPTPNAYLRTKVLTAGPAELRLLLFEGAIKFAQQALTGLEQKKYEQAFNGFSRCQDIVMELINSLRPEHDPELCDKLTALYTFIYGRLVSASTQRDPALVHEAISLLQYERDTWQMVIQKHAAENANSANMQQTPASATAHGTPVGDSQQNGEASPKPTHPSGLIGGKVSLKG